MNFIVENGIALRRYCNGNYRIINEAKRIAGDQGLDAARAYTIAEVKRTSRGARILSEHTGAELKARRMALKLSQKEMAEMMGYTPEMYCLVENGKHTMFVGFYEKFCQAETAYIKKLANAFVEKVEIDVNELESYKLRPASFDGLEPAEETWDEDEEWSEKAQKAMDYIYADGVEEYMKLDSSLQERVLDVINKWVV